MELIRISDFKLLIGDTLSKTVHKTTYTRYKQAGLVPKARKGTRSILINVSNSIERITEYEAMSQSEKIKEGLQRKENRKGGCMAFNLMNQLVRAN